MQTLMKKAAKAEQYYRLSLDETDKKILQIIQDDFPLVQEPWLEISRRLNIDEAEVDKAVKAAHRSRRHSEDRSRSLILQSRFKSSNSSRDAGAKKPSKQCCPRHKQYENVSHNYERDHEYNVWFTLAAVNNAELTQTLNDIKQKTGVKEHDILDLPTISRFKINVHFQFT